MPEREFMLSTLSPKIPCLIVVSEDDFDEWALGDRNKASAGSLGCSGTTGVKRLTLQHHTRGQRVGSHRQAGDCQHAIPPFPYSQPPFETVVPLNCTSPSPTSSARPLPLQVGSSRPIFRPRPALRLDLFCCRFGLSISSHTLKEFRPRHLNCSDSYFWLLLCDGHPRRCTPVDRCTLSEMVLRRGRRCT